MWTALTQKVRKAFTDAADQYDILTSLHKEIGRELVKKVVRHEAARILDVGCGTGYVANKAKFFYPDSTIVGMDISEGMLLQASQLHEGINIHWMEADAGALPFKDKSFDLLLSNLAYQWTGDLAQSYKEARRVLSTGGRFNITLFGGRTCEELVRSLQSVNPAMKLRNLPTVDSVALAMDAAGFKDAKIDYELIKVEFKDLLELMGWLKAIGANQLSDQYLFLGKQMLSRANDFYRANHPYNQGICASFEVIWVYGQA
jgi:malonyl-CoA O-methyltransferase